MTLALSTGQHVRALDPTRETNTLLWTLSDVPKVGRKPTLVRVSVSGVRWRGLPQPPVVYTVHLIKK